MGYDMRTVERPEGEAERVSKATEVFRLACSERDKYERGSEAANLAQEAVEVAYDAMYRADTSYFRLNIWGMPKCREIMDRFGMLYAENYAEPPFPEVDYELLDKLEDGELDGEDDQSKLDRKRAEKQQAALDEKLRWRPEGATGIAVHKLGSNDGWLVTPEEIREALNAWDRVVVEVAAILAAATPWWPDWIEYLRRAEKLGGFKVH